ncbi:hypothetical protein BC828DRAFT_406043 [Blastocladiella britannica]|nr:hypothetical protein BC828DRAFT_406043 [Blastocladiella britannica]
MIRDVANHVFAYAAANAPDRDAALAILHVLPGAGYGVTDAVLSLGFPEFLPALAVKHGHAHLVSRYPRSLLTDCFSDVFGAAAARSDFTTLNWLYLHFGPTSLCHAEWSPSLLLTRVTAGGRNDVLDWYHALSGVPKLRHSDIELMAYSIVTGEHMSVLAWLNEHQCRFLNINIITEACQYGKLAVLQWVWSQPTAPSIADPADLYHAQERALRCATDEGHVSVLEWMDQHFGPGMVDSMQSQDIESLIDGAFGSGHAAAVEWWWNRWQRHPNHLDYHLRPEDEVAMDDTKNDGSDGDEDPGQLVEFGTLGGLVEAAPNMTRDIIEWVVAKLEHGDLLYTDEDGDLIEPELKQLLPSEFEGLEPLDFLQWWWTTCKANDWPFHVASTFAAHTVRDNRTDVLEWAWDHVRSEAGFQSNELFYAAFDQRDDTCTLEWLWSKGSKLTWPTLSEHWKLGTSRHLIGGPLSKSVLIGLDWWYTHPGISVTELEDLARRAVPFTPFELWCRTKLVELPSGFSPLPLAAILNAHSSPLRTVMLTHTYFPQPDPNFDRLISVDTVAATEWMRLASGITPQTVLELAPRAILGKHDAPVVMWWAKKLLDAGKRVVLPYPASQVANASRQLLKWQLVEAGVPVYVPAEDDVGGVDFLFPI